MTEIDLVVRAPGVVRPEGDVVRVTTEIGGTVERIYVKEGDEVHLGDAMLQFEDREIRTEGWVLERQIDLIDAQLRNVERLLDDNVRIHSVEALKLEAEIENARRELEHRRSEHEAAERVAEIQLGRAREEYAINHRLMTAGLGSRQTRDRAWDELLLAEARQIDLAGRTPSDASMKALVHSRNLVDAQFELKQREFASQAAPLEAQLTELHLQLERVKLEQTHHTIRSPVDGRLTFLQTLHPGETISASAQLATIAPQSAKAVVEVFVPNHDAEDVQRKQPVRLILKDSSAVNGRIQSVSPDARFNDAGSGAHRVVVTPETDELLMGSALEVRFIVGRERLLLLLVTRVTRGFRNWTGG